MSTRMFSLALQTYLRDPDETTVAETIKAIAICALRLPSATDDCWRMLLELLRSPKSRSLQSICWIALMQIALQSAQCRRPSSLSVLCWNKCHPTLTLVDRERKSSPNLSVSYRTAVLLRPCPERQYITLLDSMRKKALWTALLLMCFESLQKVSQKRYGSSTSLEIGL